MSHVRFSDLRSAAYCPRQCYYARLDGNRDPPPGVEQTRALADLYDDLLAASDAALAAEPIALDPTTYREALTCTRECLRRVGRWDALCDPADRDVLVTGRRCRGIVHKVLPDPLEPSLVAAGRPPEHGVWEPRSVHAVAAAKALSREHGTAVERAWVEYPAYGEIRRVDLTTRRRARYRRALRTVRTMDGPPPRTRNRAKCDACEYAAECGVRTRTLRSLLGFEFGFGFGSR